MDRDEALELLLGGESGIEEWNRRLREEEDAPYLTGLNLAAASVRGERYQVIEGKTPEISIEQARPLLGRVAEVIPRNLTRAMTSWR